MGDSLLLTLDAFFQTARDGDSSQAIRSVSCWAFGSIGSTKPQEKTYVSI